MAFQFFVDLYVCIGLLTQMCLILTALYPSKIFKILLGLIWSICSAFFCIVIFIFITQSSIFKWYDVVSVRQIWVSKRTRPHRSTKNKFRQFHDVVILYEHYQLLYAKRRIEIKIKGPNWNRSVVWWRGGRGLVSGVPLLANKTTSGVK